MGNEDIDTYSEHNISCNELTPQNGLCFYEMVIPTNLACLMTNHVGEYHGLGATAWISIIFLIATICYCVAGYVLNATRYGKWKDVLGNVPNANIWCCCCYKERAYITVTESETLIQDEF